MESAILKNLNDRQKEAVTHTEGPLVIIAGAGSGKTRVLAHRVAYLIHEKKIQPQNILAVTFTNKAASEMRQRIVKLLGISIKSVLQFYDLPTIGTFHSFCVRILRKYIHLLDFENNFTIYDEADQMILMKHIMEDLGFNEKSLTPKSVLNCISKAKNELITPKKFQSMIDSSFASKVAMIYPHYQKALQKNSALDFDDLIMKTAELFEKHQKPLQECQNKFKYINIDEYQDTNHSQYVLTNLLAKKYRNLCVIGDSDQSIYSWRGADIRNILDFKKDYQDAKIVKLEQNYRSTQLILDAANAFIRNQEKKLWTQKKGGEKIQLFSAENERHEAEFIVREIMKAIEAHEHPDYRDFAVLYRINAQSRSLEEAFMRYGMSYKIVGGIRFYERKEIKDLLAYLRVIQNPHDTVSLLRIINVPQRNIGLKTISYLQDFANKKHISVFEAMLRSAEIAKLQETKVEAIEKFVKTMKKLQKINSEFPASGVIKHVLDMTGYKKFLESEGIEGEARLENVKELISVASKYNTLAPGLSLNIFLEEISLLTDADMLDEKENSVTLMTLHSAKGLEFNTVFICGLEDGLLPHGRSLFSAEELAEERRLFYVGITRAMDYLYLIYAKNRMLYGEYQDTIPSQFLNDIPEELLIRNDIFERQHQSISAFASAAEASASADKPVPVEFGEEFNAGDRIFHKKFGEGVVTEIAGGIIVVVFKNPKVGLKKLALNIAPIEKI